MTSGSESGDGREPEGYLPTIRTPGVDDPVVELRDSEGELVYSRRVVGRSFTPPVFRSGTHRLRVGDPDRDRWEEKTIREEERTMGSLDFEIAP